MAIEHISGRNAGKIILYALSTCVWCRKTKVLLNDMGVQYNFVDVDLLHDKERDDAIKAIQKWNPAGSFPTMVINDAKSIIGFKEDEIRKTLTV